MISSRHCHALSDWPGTLGRWLTISAVALALFHSSVRLAAADQPADEQTTRALQAIWTKVLAGLVEADSRRNQLDEAGLRLGVWSRIGPFRDQGPLVSWMDNVASSFPYEFEVERDIQANGHAPLLDKQYAAPNFPATPKALRRWVAHPQWIDGYYQQLPRGPAPSAGEGQYLYRTIIVDSPVEAEIDLIIRAGFQQHNRPRLPEDALGPQAGRASRFRCSDKGRRRDPSRSKCGKVGPHGRNIDTELSILASFYCMKAR